MPAIKKIQVIRPSVSTAGAGRQKAEDDARPQIPLLERDFRVQLGIVQTAYGFASMLRI